MSERLVELAQRLQSLAQTGLAFDPGHYDIQRYEEITQIAAELMTLGHPDLKPIFSDGFQSQIGYATPKVDIRGIVLRDGKILMGRESEDGLWSLPGGWADVGDRPSEAVEREVREETGLEVKAVRLLGVWDRNLHGHPPHPFHIYKLFFLCEEIGGKLTVSDETSEVGFFDTRDLPPLSLTRVVAEEIEVCLTLAANPAATPYFD